MNPKIIKRDILTIAGTFGDGNKTAEVWNAFERLCNESPLENKLSDNGYEIRLYDGGTSTVYTGFAVSGSPKEKAYAVYVLPASEYAVFDIYVANGYESENNAMNEWLQTNKVGLYGEIARQNSLLC